MNRKYLKIIILLALVVVVMGGAYALAQLRDKKGTGNNSGAPTDQNVTVNRVDIAKATTPEEKVIQGFPKDIPLEYEDFKESYSMVYAKENVGQYTVSYVSSKTKAQKYKEYSDYMTQAGYQFGTNGKNEAQGTLYGVKNGDDLSIVISTSGNKTFVQMSFLDRK